MPAPTSGYRIEACTRHGVNPAKAGPHAPDLSSESQQRIRQWARDAAADQPGHDRDVRQHAAPERELERALDRLVPELLLRDERTGPAAEQVDEMQRALGNPLRAALRGLLVQPVHQVRQQAQPGAGKRDHQRQYIEYGTEHERKQACDPEQCPRPPRSAEHTSELKSLMRNSYDVFC